MEFHDQLPKMHLRQELHSSSRPIFCYSICNSRQFCRESRSATRARCSEWLFPSPYKNGPLSRKLAYLLITKVGKRLGVELYPHFLRAQRASQLASEYDFREASLLEWFQWAKWETAKKYCKLGPLGLAKKMGVKFRRKRGLKPKEIESLVTD